MKVRDAGVKLALIACLCIAAPLAPAQTAKVRVDASRIENRVSPRMYAAFAEMMDPQGRARPRYTAHRQRMEPVLPGSYDPVHGRSDLASCMMNGFERDGDTVGANCISDLLNGWGRRRDPGKP